MSWFGLGGQSFRKRFRVEAVGQVGAERLPAETGRELPAGVRTDAVLAEGHGDATVVEGQASTSFTPSAAPLAADSS